MEVPTCAYRRWQDYAAGVDGLEDAEQVAATCDFLDENGCEALGAELLVYAEEVDLGCLQHLLADS